jgi:ClpP class serine protease
MKDPMANLFWLLFLISLLVPWYQKWLLTRTRLNFLRKIEKKRKSRVIALIHRQETMSFIGFPLIKYISIEDSEQILRAIRMTPKDMPIDLILHTPGGLVLATEQIARALKKHPAKVTVMVPHYAMSGGTLLALSADEIIMDENAVLGPVDPQLGQFPAASILKVVKKKSAEKIEDNTLILADESEKAIRQVQSFVKWCLEDKFPEEKAKELAQTFSEGRWTHDYPLMVETLRELGIPVNTELPMEVYQLMNLYPQSNLNRPSVQFIPLPYNKDHSEPGAVS